MHEAESTWHIWDPGVPLKTGFSPTGVGRVRGPYPYVWKTILVFLHTCKELHDMILSPNPRDTLESKQVNRQEARFLHPAFQDPKSVKSKQRGLDFSQGEALLLS